MLIPNSTLAQIKSGDVTLAFRRWHRPTVKSGGTLMTAIGLLNVEELEEILPDEITDADAKLAGYESRQALDGALAKREGKVFKITLTYAGADPRIDLRENTHLTDAEFGALRKRLARMDARSKAGEWTQRTLSAIEKRPNILAAEVAKEIGVNKEQFKTNVRKLKNLGLTISQKTGYTLSPRGRVVLEHLRGGV